MSCSCTTNILTLYRLFGVNLGHRVVPLHFFKAGFLGLVERSSSEKAPSWHASRKGTKPRTETPEGPSLLRYQTTRFPNDNINPSTARTLVARPCTPKLMTRCMSLPAFPPTLSCTVPHFLPLYACDRRTLRGTVAFLPSVGFAGGEW